MIKETVAGVITQKVVSWLSNRVVTKIDEEKLRLEIQAYFDQKRTENSILRSDDELFEKITECFWEDNMPIIENAIFGTQSERKEARENLYSNTCDTLNIHDNKTRREVAKIIKDIVSIAKKYYSSRLSRNEQILKEEIVDDISSVLAEVTKVHSSPINYDVANAAAEKGDSDLIAKSIMGLHGFLDMTHELYPDYGIEMIGPEQYISKPLSCEAINKYPPKFKLKGIATIGDRVLPCLTLNDIDYANRHQQDIVINITEAQKFLGEKVDPYQYEAQQMIGEKLVKKPEPFAPAEPFNIKIDGQIVYDYIELRLIEELDDGSIVISNREQNNCGIELTLTHNFETNASNFTVIIKDKSNKGYLKNLKFMRDSMRGYIMEIYSLKHEENLLEGKCKGFTIDRNVDKLDEEIEFLDCICAIEDRFNISIKLPELISETDFNQTRYLYKLINNENIENCGRNFKMDMTLSEESHDAFAEMEDTEIILWMNIDCKIDLFGFTFNMPIKRTVSPARIAEISRIKEIAKLLKVGEKITLEIIADKGKIVDVLEGAPKVN